MVLGSGNLESGSLMPGYAVLDSADCCDVVVTRGGCPSNGNAFGETSNF